MWKAVLIALARVAWWLSAWFNSRGNALFIASMRAPRRTKNQRF